MEKEKKKKVIIAEDDGFISEMYETKLSAEGLDVELVCDGEEALKRIGKSNPDVVLLDIMMPRLSGLDVLEKIRTDKKLADIIVIVLTNASEKEYVDRAMKMGADGYLVKSNFTPDEVVAEIKKRIKK